MRPVRPALLVVALAAMTALTGCAGTAAPRASSDPAPTSTRTAAESTSGAGTAGTSGTTAASSAARRTASAATTPPTPRTSPPSPATSRPSSTSVARRLPVQLPTGASRQVITVVAAGPSSTTATLQAWQRSGSSGWLRVGPSVRAFLGSDGSSTSPSETRSATPIGSFTLTHAFGHDPDPGTRLPYRRTSPADWWISQSGSLYNTLQRCSAHCPFTLGNPNEHLYYETPAYDYAVVIDYNTANAPGGVKPGAGSAFFLHVSEGEPTAGCVSIPAADLVRVMRWLDPRAQPRILIAS